MHATAILQPVGLALQWLPGNGENGERNRPAQIAVPFEAVPGGDNDIRFAAPGARHQRTAASLHIVRLAAIPVALARYLQFPHGAQPAV